MTVSSRLEILQSKPIGDGLNGVHDSFNSICQDVGISASLQALDQIGSEDIQNLSLALVSALQILPAARLLRSKTGNNLFSHLAKLNSAISSDDFNIEQIRPLWNAVLNKESDDVIWNKVEAAVTESTPPPRPPSSFPQTPWVRNTSSFANSTEHRKYVDGVLKEELGPLYVGVPGFFEAYFGSVAGLQPAARAVFDKCKEGDSPLYQKESGWQDWPKEAREKDVLSWFAELTGQFLDFAEEHQLASRARRRPLAQPHQRILDSTAD
ncbi:hypothetical protein DM02DRAFT_577221, partial [Periconia macrospinosa]